MGNTSTTDTRQTMAEQVRDLGGGGLPTAALDIFHGDELKTRALRSDQKISDAYRREQLAALDAETDAALFAARDREVAAAVKALDQREGAILAEIRGERKRSTSSIESTDEQRERHFRAAHESTALLADLITVQSLQDPDALLDAVEEAAESGRPERVRRLAPVALAQLEGLKRRKQSGADAAYLQVLSLWQNYQKQHPSLIKQLRAVRAERRTAAQPHDRNYTRAREHFRFGAANGMRL